MIDVGWLTAPLRIEEEYAEDWREEDADGGAADRAASLLVRERASSWLNSGAAAPSGRLDELAYDGDSLGCSAAATRAE